MENQILTLDVGSSQLMPDNGFFIAVLAVSFIV